MSHLSNTAALMNPGEWRLLCTQGDGSNYGNPIWPPALVADTGAGYRIFEYSSTAAYDYHRQRVFYHGGAHVTGDELPGEGFRQHYGFVCYDIPSNHWSALPIGDFYNDFAGNPHPYNFNHYIPSERSIGTSVANQGDYYKLNVDVDNLAAITGASWVSAPADPAYLGHNGRGFHIAFPDRDSELRYIPDVGVIQEMKHTESQWKTIFTPSPTWLMEGGGAAYSPIHKKLMFGGGYDGTTYNYRFWLYDASGSTPTATTNLPFQAGVGPWPYYSKQGFFWADPVSGDFLSLTINNDWTGYVFYRYNMAANSWTRLIANESAVPLHMGSDEFGPADLHLVDMATLIDHGVSLFMGRNVYLYKHTANADAAGLTHARKVAIAPGVIAAYGFDSQSNVRTYPATAYPLRYTNLSTPWTGSCIPIFGTGTGAPFDPAVRGSSEANARTAEFATVCHYPQADTTVFNAAGGGTGALRITVPSNSGEGVGGFFDSPFQGVDFPKVNIAPHNYGQIWYQLMLRTQNMLHPAVIASMANPGVIGPKLLIGGGGPPWLLGSSENASHDALVAIRRRGVFTAYTYDSFGQLIWTDATVGSDIMVQNVVSCYYWGSGDPRPYYPTPPCVAIKDDGSWQQVTWRFELVPVTGCTISGTALTKTGGFTFSSAQYVNRWIYVQPEGSVVGAYYTITAKVSDNQLTLSGSPAAGTAGARRVVISSLPNSKFEMWIDGQKIISIANQPVFWDGSSIASQTPAGFGAFRVVPQMTGKDNTMAHPDAYCWYDDLIISTYPIPMSQSTVAPPPPSTPAAPCLPWMLR